MLRVLLTVILPILLPILLYAGYIALMRRRAQAAGQETLPEWHEGPWLWLVLAGSLLLVAALATVRLSTGVEPGTKLEAPRLIDGKIEPSRVVE